MSFDYFYGQEADSFSFYRIPKVLITDVHFKGLSTDAKLLYGLLLDRMSLSMRNGWLDEDDRVYIYYTLEEVQSDLGCAHGKAVKLLAELDSAKGIGLIERVRQGLGKPDIIYVKQFIRLIEAEDNCAPPPSPKSGKQGFRKSNLQTSENRTSGLPKKERQDFRYADASNIYNNQTDLNQTYMSYTDPSIPPSLQDVDLGTMDRWTAKELVKSQIEYSVLVHDHPRESLIDSVADLITDVLRSNAASERINGADVPIVDVQTRFRTLNRDHIVYVMDAMRKTKSDITHLRAYLLTALYNAPPLINSHYDAAVRHDFG